MVHPDRGVMAIECKSAQGRLTLEQSSWLDTLIRAGVQAIVATFDHVHGDDFDPLGFGEAGPVEHVAAGNNRYSGVHGRASALISRPDVTKGTHSPVARHDEHPASSWAHSKRCPTGNTRRATPRLAGPNRWRLKPTRNLVEPRCGKYPTAQPIRRVRLR